MELHLPVGTLVNALAVVAGGGAGLLLRRGLPERYRRGLLTAVGLATLALGAQMALAFDNALLLIGSLALGALAGEALRIDERLNALAQRVAGGTASLSVGSAAVPAATAAGESPGPPASGATPAPAQAAGGAPASFAQGLVTAFLVFCIGPLTLLGALSEGLHGDPSLLLAKSALDLATSFVLAASFGAGVILAAVPLLAYQLALTLLGAAAQTALSPQLATQLTAVGGVLILGLGLNLLEVARLKVSNLLPALAVAALLQLLAGG